MSQEGRIGLALAGLAALLLAGCSSAQSGVAPSSAPSSPASPATAPSSSPPADRALLGGPVGGPVPTGFQPASLTFVSATDGWVLGTAVCSPPPCTSVVRTRDGGHGWQGVPAPRVALAVSGAASGVSRLRFADRFNGFAFGPDLYVTHDGGSSWKQLPVPGGQPGSRVTSLEAAAGVAYAGVSVGGSGPGLSQTVQLYRTSVGSDAWQPVTGVSVAGGAAADVVLHGRTGWFLASTAGPERTVFATSDGDSWTRRDLPCGGAQLASALERDLLLVCGGNSGAGQQGKLAYVSHDGGQSFQQASSPPLSGILQGLAFAPGVAVVAASSGASWLYGSFDGGRSWATVYQDGTLGGAPWDDLGLTTASQGAAILGAAAPAGDGPQSRMLMTRDGGHSWATVAFKQVV